MKTLIYTVTILLVIGLIAGGLWLFVFSKKPANGSVSSSTGSLPGLLSGSAPHATVQQISSPENSEVAQGLLNSVQNGSQMTLGGTVVASPFALQVWGDSNQGGEALLEDMPSAGWTLVSLGGGEWTVFDLMQQGVSLAGAEQLVGGLGLSAATSTSVAANAPSGDTITLGTSEGSVTMNNFYSNPLYISPDQQNMVLVQTSTYDIVYNVRGSTFTVSLFSAPLQDVRQAAESAFLSYLNISEPDACKLGVYERVTNNVDIGSAAAPNSLSFCATGAFQGAR